MATMILLPDGSNGVSSDWIVVGAGSVKNALMFDDGVTAYVKCDDVTETMNIEFANPSVAEGDIDTIDSVRFLSSGKSNHRSSPTRISVAYYDPFGNPSENANYLAHRTNFTTINGTARPYSNGSGVGSVDWTYANLEDLEMRVTMASIYEVYFSYLAMEVTYTPAATDNATFFGANF